MKKLKDEGYGPRDIIGKDGLETDMIENFKGKMGMIYRS